VESLDRFQQSRAVIEDFTSRTLSVIHSDYGRLYYVSSLKDQGTGSYEHDGLKQIYSEGSVQQALTQCHEELFSRILETPLEDQERDLRSCLEFAGEKMCTATQVWREGDFVKTLCPVGLPGYLSDLFCSNMTAILGLISAEHVN
jgi:hypothetical protein